MAVLRNPDITHTVNTLIRAPTGTISVGISPCGFRTARLVAARRYSAVSPAATIVACVSMGKLVGRPARARMPQRWGDPTMLRGTEASVSTVRPILPWYRLGRSLRGLELLNTAIQLVNISDMRAQ